MGSFFIHKRKAPALSQAPTSRGQGGHRAAPSSQVWALPRRLQGLQESLPCACSQLTQTNTTVMSYSATHGLFSSLLYLPFSRNHLEIPLPKRTDGSGSLSTNPKVSLAEKREGPFCHLLSTQLMLRASPSPDSRAWRSADTAQSVGSCAHVTKH